MDDVPPSAITSAGETAVIRQIESDFPGWGAWRSDTGRWWAFRTASNPLSIEQLRAGCRLIVQADDEAALRGAIEVEIVRCRRTGRRSQPAPSV